MKQLLVGILEAENFLDDGLHCGQDGRIFTQGEDVCDLGIQEAWLLFWELL